MKKILILALILIPTLALFYFALGRDPRELPSTRINKPAPDFKLKTIDGAEVSLSSFRGNPVVINFWSTWCGTCAAEHALFREAKSIFGPRGVRFYSILYDDKPENVRSFVQEYGEGVPVLIDPDLKTAIDYGVAGVPETFFIDTHGKVIDKRAGYMTHEYLQGQMGRLLGGIK